MDCFCFFLFMLIVLGHCFLTCLLFAQHEGTEQAPIATASTYTSTAKKPGIGPAQSIEIHAALRSCRPEGDNASKQTKVREKALLLLLKYFAEKPPTIKLDFSQVPLTLSPVTDHRPGAIHYF